MAEYVKVSPESAGIPSGEILAFLKELTDERFCLHDMLIIRDGKLLFETYWKPMNKDFMHRQYSCSKSYVSVAVGIAVGEGLLSLDDPVTKFFPDKVPDPSKLHPYLAACTVRDLLRMSTCFTYGAHYSPQTTDWTDDWFNAKPSHMPGKVYNYDTHGTTMLCMIVKRVTGMEFFDYLRSRVFDKIGFDPEHQAWCVETCCGHHWGGSGVVCKNYDYARFAELCMNYGSWNGEQLVPEWYMREATTKQIDIQHDLPSRVNTGYGYQFWVLPHGGFSFNGMGCQYALCFPEQKLLLVTHGYEELAYVAKSKIFGGFMKHILPYAQRPAEPIAAVPEDVAALCNFTENLKMATPDGLTENASAIEKFAGKTFAFGEENEFGWKNARLEFAGDTGTLFYENRSGNHSITFGFGRQFSQPFPETAYFDRRIGTPCGFGYPTYSSAAWVERTSDGGWSDAMAIWCQLVGSHLGQLRITLSLKDNTMTVVMRNHAEWFLPDYVGFGTGEIKE